MGNKKQHFHVAAAACLLALFLIFNIPLANARLFRSSKEYTSINTDFYEISIRKNGTIAVNAVYGAPLLINAEARMGLDGMKTFKRLNTHPNNATRFQVNDPLGQGQGILFRSHNCEWYCCTYPGKPFFTVRLVYINNGKSEVRIKALSPWYIAPETKGAINLEADATESRLSADISNANESAHYPGMAAIQHPHSGRTYTAGFLTHKKAENQVFIGRTDKAAETEWDEFRAVCYYNPPVIVRPGERLETDIFYLAITEAAPLAGIQNFGTAVAAAMGIRPPRNSSCGFAFSVVADTMTPADQRWLTTVDFQRRHLLDWGWKSIALGKGWECMPGDWQPNPCYFPEGFAPWVRAAVEAGLEPFIHLQPFRAAPDSGLLKMHPHWALPCNDDNEIRVLDVAQPEVRQWLVELSSSLAEKHGFQAIILDRADVLLNAPDNGSGLTGVERYGIGLKAMQEGLQKAAVSLGKPIPLIVTPSHPAALPYADALGPAGTVAPEWFTSDNAHPGVLDHLMALNKNYWSAFTGVPHYAGPLYMGMPPVAEISKNNGIQPVSKEQRLAWLVATAMSGSAVVLSDDPGGLTEADIAVLRRFSPPLSRPAFPVNEFENIPDQFYMPLKTKCGEWHLAACFNWSRLKTVAQTLDLAKFGLDGSTKHSLFEFFPGIYHGLAAEKTELSIAPASVRFFGLRPYEGHPMLLASDRHISQGAMDHTAIVWNGQKKELHGTFKADPIPYRLRFLTPPPWQLLEAKVNGGACQATQSEEEVIVVAFEGVSGMVDWTLTFQ